MQPQSSAIVMIFWIMNIIIHNSSLTTTATLTASKPLCLNRLRKRELSESVKNEQKPCCLPETWKARFVVHSAMAGRTGGRVDYGAFRLRRLPDGEVEQALLVVGKTVASSDFCRLNSTQDARWYEKLCPNDRVSCLSSPFLGEPRCLAERNGYRLKRSKPIPRSSSVEQTWFIDRINRLFGVVERHSYRVLRKYGLCKLLDYQIEWGHYVLPWRSCRLFVRMEQIYHPVKGSFKLNFQHNLTDHILFC